MAICLFSLLSSLRKLSTSNWPETHTQKKSIKAHKEKRFNYSDAIHTLTPFFVELDNLVDEINTGESLPLRISDDLRIVPLLFSKQIDIQHYSANSSIKVLSAFLFVCCDLWEPDDYVPIYRRVLACSLGLAWSLS